MKTQRKNRHFSPAGKRLQEAIYKKYGDAYDSITKFVRDLADELCGTKFETIQSTISNMMSGADPSHWNKKYFLPIERLLNVRMADIIDDVQIYTPSPRGLYEIGTQGTYKDFQWLSEQKDGYVDVIKSYDEWSKGICDYVYESKNIEGLRFLVDHGFYQVLEPGKIMANHYHAGSEDEQALILLDLLSQDKDPESKMFIKLFDTHARSDIMDLDRSIYWNENAIKTILEREKFLKAVCRKPDVLPESAINARKRVVVGGEYQAICASNWLTPLLCYSLDHESDYREQAIKLLEVSYDVANATVTNIGQNKELLGGDDSSISTEKGRVLLGHNYVIGIIGEPITKGEIKDPELREKASKITAKIGSFRAMAKFQTPVIVNGKMHLPSSSQNPLYRKFIAIAKGHAFLLQIEENNDGDACNCVFKAPQGKPAFRLSSDQWFQVGQALKSIHQIDTGVEGKVFCHGRFNYSDFYVLPNGDLEFVSGYLNVHIGDYEEDIFAAGALAFNNNYFDPDVEQEEIKAFLKGYGYPEKDFLQKLYDYLTMSAKMEKNENGISFMMDSATGVLRVLNAM
ncbi:MAG: hypothetical protein SPL80_07115 [Bacilli bacterium]|nr:hypothetical protein [Bacilli bacterium]